MVPALLAARTALTFVPAAGLVGLALYQAANQHDYQSAYQSLLQAAGVAGLGSYLHVAQAPAAPSK